MVNKNNTVAAGVTSGCPEIPTYQVVVRSNGDSNVARGGDAGGAGDGDREWVETGRGGAGAGVVGGSAMKLDFAQRCVERLVQRLAPHCLRLEVAGSIRRGRPEVGDIDLVAIPLIKAESDLFGNVVRKRNCLFEAIRDWVKEGDGRSIVRGFNDAVGNTMGTFLSRGVQVDLWCAEESTFGTVMLCRTGSLQHNIWLTSLAKSAGGKWDPHHGVSLPGKPHVSGRLEGDVYEALGLPWIEPKDREIEYINKLSLGSVSQAVCGYICGHRMPELPQEEGDKEDLAGAFS